MTAGKKGKVKLGEQSEITGQYGAISATKVKIDDNVLLKMKQRTSSSRPYIAVNGAEAEVGTRSDDPTASGLVNTIGANTELWYLNENNRPQKIVHGKNVCAHVPGKVVKKVDATCTEDGYIEYECNYEHENGAPGNSCGRTWTETIPKIPHNYGEWTVTTHATCTTDGSKERECSVCHQKETETIPALKHDWGDWQLTKAPTCMEKGEEKRECKVCDKPETREVDKLDHVEELRGAKEPTCTEPGYTGDKWCTRGDHLLEKGASSPHRPPLGGQGRRHPHLPRLRCHRGPAFQHQQRP